MNTHTNKTDYVILHRLSCDYITPGNHVYTLIPYNTDNVPLCGLMRVQVSFSPRIDRYEYATEEDLTALVAYDHQGVSQLTVLREDNSDDPVFDGYEGSQDDNTPETIEELLGLNWEYAVRAAITKGVYCAPLQKKD